LTSEGTIGALAVAYMSGLAMRKAADLHPGQAKADLRDAFIITNTARTFPHTPCLRWTAMVRHFAHSRCRPDSMTTSPGTPTRMIERLRSTLAQIYPLREHVSAGEVLQRANVDAPADPLRRADEAEALQQKRVLTWSRNHAKKDPEALANSIFQALDAQTVTVPGHSTRRRRGGGDTDADR
jgi:hypothetical protein